MSTKEFIIRNYHHMLGAVSGSTFSAAQATVVGFSWTLQVFLPIAVGLTLAVLSKLLGNFIDLLWTKYVLKGKYRT